MKAEFQEPSYSEHGPFWLSGGLKVDVLKPQ
jgi:hypothetical protein